MARDDIGSVCCAFCQGTAPVRKNAKSKLYYVCSGCGIVQPNMPGFQEWILSNARITGGAIDLPRSDYTIVDDPPALPATATAPGVVIALPVGQVYETAPAPKPEPKKPRGFGAVRW